MTRGAMKVFIRQQLSIYVGGLQSYDDFSMDSAINSITDELAGPGIDCYWNYQTFDIVSGQSDYCASEAYKVTGISWKDALSYWRPLPVKLPETMDKIHPGWRNTPSSAFPRIVIRKGSGWLQLWPTPNFSVDEGIKVEGFMQTNASGVSTWAADSANCPLPTWSHTPICWGAAWLMAMQGLMSVDETVAKRMSMGVDRLEAKWKQQKGIVESAAYSQYDTAANPSTWEALGYNYIGSWI